MKKTTAIVALGLVLSAAACTTEDPTPPGELVEGAASTDRVGDVAEQSVGPALGDGEQASATGEDPADFAEPEPGAEPICVELFEGDAPLIGKIGPDRGLIAIGETIEESEFEQISTLRDRLVALAAEAPAEQSRAIEQLNEPFVQAVESVESGGGQDPESEEIVLPQLDVSGSTAAQDQLALSCEG